MNDAVEHAAAHGESAATPKKRGRWWLKLGLAAMSLTVGILVVELIGGYGLKKIKRSRPRLPDEVAATVRGSNRAVDTIPDPYLLYRVKPNLATDHAKINRHGLRNGPIDDVPAPDVFRVLVLGGSVAWGYNARNDEDALPAMLQRTLTRDLADGRDVPAALRGKRIEVLGGGVFAYVCWQGVLAYVRQHRRLRPHAIVTLDGANEVYGAIRTAEPGFPMRWAPQKAAYGVDDPSFVGKLGEWAAFRAENMKIVKYFRKANPPKLADREVPAPARVAHEYGKALELLHDLAGVDGAQVLAVLQPMAILPDTKPLAPFEKTVVEQYDARIPGQNAYYASCFDAFREMLAALRRDRPTGAWIDGTKIYRGDEKIVFCDDCHVSLHGRERLTAFLSEQLITALARRDASASATRDGRRTEPRKAPATKP